MITFKDVEEFMQKVCDDPVSHVPGMDLFVYHKHKPVYRHLCGYSDLENKIPVKGNELYYLYSCTKVVTCVAALTLYEKGTFLLSDPVYEYIPEWKDVKYRDENGNLHSVETPVTVGQLFTMTGGLNYNLQADCIKEVYKNTGGRCPTLEIAKAFAKEPLEFQPGECWNYGFGHDILAALIEVWSGKKYSEYVKESIFEPLGMNNSFYHMTGEIKSRMAQEYTQAEGDYTSRNIKFRNEYVLGSEYESGGAGLISCTEDLMKFLEGVSSHKVLSKATFDLMATPRLNEKQRRIYKTWRGKSDYNYGLGVRVRTAFNGNFETLAALGEFGWDGAAGSYLSIIPKDELSIVYVQHQRMQQGNKEREGLINMLLCALENEGILERN